MKLLSDPEPSPGDGLAGVAFEETADLARVWLGKVMDLSEPDVIVIGGDCGVD